MNAQQSSMHCSTKPFDDTIRRTIHSFAHTHITHMPRDGVDEGGVLPVRRVGAAECDASGLQSVTPRGCKA